MRWLVVLLMLPLAQAGILSLEDAGGDVAYQGVIEQEVPWNSADLRSATLEENATGFTLSVAVEAFDDRGAPLVHHMSYVAYLQHREQPFAAEMWRWWQVEGSATGEPAIRGFLHTLDRTTGEVLTTTETDAVADDAAATLSMHLPRQWLADETGAAPFAGREIEVSHVSSHATDIFLSPAALGVPAPEGRITDRMPNAGTWPEPLVVEAGSDSASGIRIGSPDPFRLSNGEATTFLYALALRNDRTEEMDVNLAAAQAPEGWDVRFPQETLRLAPESVHETAVAVRVPFAHQHGGRDEVPIEVRQAGHLVATTVVGVQYTTTPQPSGHHPFLYLHSRAPSDPEVAGVRFLDAGIPYLNSLEDDPDDAARPVEALGSMQIPLRPSLAMDLHFTGQEGTMDLTFVSDVDIDDVQLSGALLMVDRNGTETVLLQVLDEEKTPASRGQVVEVRARLLPEAGRVPYAKGAQLVLDLGVRTSYPGRDMMGDLLWLEGGTLHLPLQEYADEMSEVFTTLGSLRLSTPTAQKLVNPGSTAVFSVTLENTGSHQITPVLQLAGREAEWGRIVGAPGRVAPGASGQIQVAVTPPSTASAGDQADMLLEARHGGELIGLLRLVASVTQDPVPDESHLVEDVPAKKSPVIWPPAALGLALWLRRD